MSARLAALYCVHIVALFFWVHEFVPLAGLGLAAVLGAGSNARVNVPKQAAIAFGFIAFYVGAVALPALYFDPVPLWGRLIATPLAAGAAFLFLEPERADIERLFRLLAVSCTTVSVLMYAQIGPFQITTDPGVLLTRYRGDGYWALGNFYEGAPAIAGPAGIATICATLSTLATRGFRRLLFLGMAITGFAILVLTISRGGLVATCGALLLLLATPRRLVFLAILAVIGIGVFNATIGSIPSAESRYRTMLALSQDASMVGRFNIWSETLRVAEDRVEGAGFSYRHTGLTAHNEILGHLLGAGILGAMAYLLYLSLWAYRGVTYLPALSLGAFFGLIGLVENFTISSGTLLYPVFWLIGPALLMHEYSDKYIRLPPNLRAVASDGRSVALVPSEGFRGPGQRAAGEPG